MDDCKLIWKTESTEKLLHTRVFDVLSLHERAANGVEGDYIALDAPDCVVVLPVHDGNFIMVRQWRHGAGRLTTEFPGGVIDRGEDPDTAAARELSEETGFNAGRLTRLGEFSPNPALFNSVFYVYLAEELIPADGQHLDADELVDCVEIPIDEVVSSLGTGDFCHAFMGAAIALYLRTRDR